MCWAVPAKVLEVRGMTALVDFGRGVEKEVIVAVSDIKEGDLVLVHAGAIISKVRAEEVLKSIEIYKEMAVELAVEQGVSREEAEEQVEESMREWLQSLGIGYERA